MDKTRMGKRVASLLLSLVMMLSLLPTAAYATMADGVETQGAIVSENGTGVSDDSNSSGNTDDLQVGDSKDSDGTGDQQVEGSSGSGTADDTTGTEGGADPTDSVNGNDSADPQDDGDAVLPTATTVAKVGDTEYATLEAAIAALSSSSYTLELLDETAWDLATPVYWAAGSESGYAATLAEALTAAYKANADAITIVCRPGADVGELTHGHVADDITIYGNNAYISGGECDLEVDTYTFSRDTGKQVEAGGAYLEKDITVTAYELDNLGVWGQRHTNYKVTVNLTDCDSTDGITVQRVYISGTTGVNDITLTGCDFGTKATSVYSNADGNVVIDNCSFTGAQVPVNFNHKANGTQTVAVQNSTFTNCGDNGDWEQFAAPVRFVNSGSGTMTTTVATCTFTGTVGSNGDILLGDGREGQKSNDVALTVESTEATVQAQQPGYYGSNGTTDASKQGTKNVAAGDKLTTSVTQLMPSETTTYVAEVGSNKYETLQAAIDAAAKNATVTLLADAAEDVVISKSITLDLGGKTLTNTNGGKATISVAGGTVTVKNGNVVGGTGYYNIEVTKGSNANLTLTDVTATAGNNGSSMIDNWGTLTITSGTYTGGLNVVKSEEGSKLTITGGTFTGNYATNGYTAVILVYGDTTISGGEFIQSATNGKWNHPQVVMTGVVEGYTAITRVTGGNFVNNKSSEGIFHGLGKATSDNFEVSGGTFNKAISEGYCADGFIPTKNADGTYGVKVGQYVAQIGSKKYETLADAIRLATKGKTITLLCDVEQNTQLTINKSITLDLNGKTIKISGYTAEKAQVCVKGNLTIQDSSEAQTGKICSDYTGTAGRVVSVENGGKLTIAGGTITTEGMSGLSGSAVYIASGAEVNMTGGAVKVDAKRGNVAMNVKGSTGVFTMSGGSVIAEAGDGTETYITAISGSSGSTIQISAGTVSGPQALLAGSSATTITGGNFTGSITVKNGSISGGTFDRALDKKACAAGYVPTQNGDGTYGVEIGMFTVMVTSRTTGSNSPVANVAGGGSNITYAQGTTVTASAISGYKFVGWFVNEYTGTPYSTDLTCEVKPTDDCTMIAVYEPISGGVFALEVSASKFTVNDGATQRSYLLEKMPIGTQVTVVFKGSENFLYWVNESGKVVSTSKTYTFSMGSATTLKAVYAEKEENQTMVVFISHTQQVISSKGYTDTQEIQFPEPPIKMGATFVRWSMTEAEIRAAMATTATGIIVVEPVYEFSAGSYTVTVNYPNDETATYTATVGKITPVTAKSIDGKVFKCWKNGDTVLGYTETLKVAPRGDLILTAEYVDAGTTVDRLPVIALTEISASQQGAKYAVSFTATRSVPDGYTVTEQGVLVSTDSRYGETGALDAMKLDADGVKPDDTKILKATNTDATGVTVLNGIVSAADRTVYGRAYMILRDSSGTMVYVYSDTILSGSYNSLTTNGGN